MSLLSEQARRCFRTVFPRRPAATAQERARRGALFLDSTDPGWAMRIDIETLRLADGGACVLGQLHGAYQPALFRARLFDGSSAPALGKAFFSPVDLGFHAQHDGDAERDYKSLTAAWRREVHQRLGASSRPPAALLRSADRRAHHPRVLQDRTADTSAL